MCAEAPPSAEGALSAEVGSSAKGVLLAGCFE